MTWRQPGGLVECPYFFRWVLDFGPVSLRLHQWLADDDARAYHDHPFWFLTIVLWGGYIDESPRNGYAMQDRLHVGSIRFRRAGHRHIVRLTSAPTWTLLLTGRASRRWGFWRNGKLIKRDKYFAEAGHHPCDPTHAPVRLRPDGSRI